MRNSQLTIVLQSESLRGTSAKISKPDMTNRKRVSKWMKLKQGILKSEEPEQCSQSLINQFREGVKSYSHVQW